MFCRTREGLGYDVRSCIENIRGVDHLAVKAVSSERNSTFLREKIISFAESLNVFLVSIFSMFKFYLMF